MKADKLMVLFYIIPVPLVFICALGFQFTHYLWCAYAAIALLVIALVGVSGCGVYLVIKE